MNRIVRWFLQGLIYFVPIALTTVWKWSKTAASHPCSASTGTTSVVAL